MDLESLSRQFREAEVHVANGEQLISRQRQIVSELAEDGLDTRDAKSVLSSLETSQTLNIRDRDQLRAKLSGDAGSPLIQD